MIQYFVRRLLAFPVILLAANFFGFAYAYYVAPIQASRNPYASIRAADLPFLFPRYRDYLGGVFHLDFGVLYNGDPIGDAILRTGSYSLGLIALSLFASVVVGLLLGMTAVRSDPPRVSSWLTAFATMGVASPSFFVAAVLITLSVLYLFYGPSDVFMIPFQGYGWDAHLILPVLALMFRPTAQIAQITSGLLVDELRKQYVVAARSFGHSLRSIRWRYAFRNILAPVVLTIAGALRLLVAELIIIERFFGWPGMGRLFSATLVSHDVSEIFLHPQLVAALLTVLAGVFFLADLIASLVSRHYDPRL